MHFSALLCTQEGAGASNPDEIKLASPVAIAVSMSFPREWVGRPVTVLFDTYLPFQKGTVLGSPAKSHNQQLCLLGYWAFFTDKMHAFDVLRGSDLGTLPGGDGSAAHAFVSLGCWAHHWDHLHAREASPQPSRARLQ